MKYMKYSFVPMLFSLLSACQPSEPTQPQVQAAMEKLFIEQAAADDFINGLPSSKADSVLSFRQRLIDVDRQALSHGKIASFKSEDCFKVAADYIPDLPSYECRTRFTVLLRDRKIPITATATLYHGSDWVAVGLEDIFRP